MSRGGIAWRRAGRGILVIGVGVFLLLNTSGALPWRFWGDLLPFWPVVLVALGLRLIFDRSRMPWAVLLSPLLVLATMTWVAVEGPHRSRPRGRAVVLEAQRPEGVSRWTLKGRLNSAQVVLNGDSMEGKLVRGEAVGSRSVSRLRTTSSGEWARVWVGSEWGNRVVSLGIPWSRSSWWEVDVAADLPLSIDLQMAATAGSMNLGSVPVTSMDLTGAFNDLEIRLGTPERDVRIVLEGAFNDYTLVLPRDVPARLESDGFLNLVDGGQGGRGPGYRIRVEGAFNSLDVENR